MALTVQSPTATEAERRTAELLAQLDDDSFQDALLADLLQRVEAFEQQYGMPSDSVNQAIDMGLLVESHEVCQWLLDYKMLLRLGVR